MPSRLLSSVAALELVRCMFGIGNLQVSLDTESGTLCLETSSLISRGHIVGFAAKMAPNVTRLVSHGLRTCEVALFEQMIRAF